MTGTRFSALLLPFFQSAYVTTDIDAAMEQFSGSLGVSRFFQMRDFESVDALGQRVRIHMAFANIPDRQFGLSSCWIGASRAPTIRNRHPCLET